jgi:transcriptional antiterminator NusG
MNDWYVLHVKTGKEHDTKAALCRDLPGVVHLVPERTLRERINGKWKEVSRILFPGYVFISAYLDTDLYYRLMAIPSVIRILGTGKPDPVPLEEMQVILRLGNEGDPLGLSEVYRQGNMVYVISGPLVGLEGQIIKVDARRFRAKVNISLMGEPRIVELGIVDISKVD